MGASEGAIVFLGVCARIAIVRGQRMRYLGGYILEKMALGEQLGTCLALVRVFPMNDGLGRADVKPLCFIEPVVGREML